MKNPKQKANKMRAAIWELFSLGKLDFIDLKIIAARDCSPMPSFREIARQLKIDHHTVSRRVPHIKALIIKALMPENQ